MKKLARGFTLIEMLVVVSLIGILATLITANLNSGRARARDAQRKSDLRNIQTALRIYYNDKGGYPTNTTSGEIKGCGPTGVATCTWGMEWLADTTVYMPVLPKDPVTAQSYKYELGGDTDTFTLSACLENKSDDKGIATTDTSWCPSGWMYQVRP